MLTSIQPGDILQFRKHFIKIVTVTKKPKETVTDTRLIGRSVWNTRWLLIIPGGTLNNDRNEGIQRFINGGLRLDGTRDGNGVSDIKIFFQTYAYSGN